MQENNLTDLIAWALIIIGSVIIISGIVSMLMRSDIVNTEERGESKGIILLGPIPIVWGYGKRVWIIAAIIAISIFLVVILWPS